MNTLVLPARLMADLDVAARKTLETAAVLLVRIVKGQDGSRRLLGRSIHWVDPKAYIKQVTDGLSISPEGYVPALAQAEHEGETALWFHTHPGLEGVPLPSLRDKHVDEQISDLFRIRSGSPYYGTLVFSPRPHGCAFSGMIQHEQGGTESIERLWIVGDTWQLCHSVDSGGPEISPLFDRNVRAFGPAIQRTLSDLHVAIIGCGGTGSSVAEQLVRLGVRRFTLVDNDTVSASNLTRLYGSTPGDVGKYKVDVICQRLRQIAEDVECTAVRSMVTVESTARYLLGADLVFGCTDDNAGRLVLSRAATYLVTPVIDMGVMLSSDPNGILTDINGRVTILVPGSPCLVCRDRIDLRRAAAELMKPDERLKLENEGYAPALGRIEPAVIAFTTAVAAFAVGEMLERFIGYGNDPRPNEILLRFHEREISTNVGACRKRHYCHSTSGKLGWGAGVPFLEQTWAGV